MCHSSAYRNIFDGDTSDKLYDVMVGGPAYKTMPRVVVIKMYFYIDR